MQSLSKHDLDALLAILVRLKKAHEIILRRDNLPSEEKLRLQDEIAVIDRLMPRIMTARLHAGDAPKR